jgi:hypothetical protein
VKTVACCPGGSLRFSRADGRKVCFRRDPGLATRPGH